MVRVQEILLAALLVVGGSGCADKEKMLMGTWKYKSVQLDAGLPPQMAEAAKSMTLVITADKKFTVRSDAGNSEGTWSFEGNTLTLKATKINGQTAEEVEAQLKQAKSNPMFAAQIAKNPQIAKLMDSMDPTKPQLGTLGDDGTLTVQGLGGKETFQKGAP